MRHKIPRYNIKQGIKPYQVPRYTVAFNKLRTVMNIVYKIKNKI